MRCLRVMEFNVSSILILNINCRGLGVSAKNFDSATLPTDRDDPSTQHVVWWTWPWLPLVTIRSLRSVKVKLFL